MVFNRSLCSCWLFVRLLGCVTFGAPRDGASVRDPFKLFRFRISGRGQECGVALRVANRNV